MGFGDPLNCEKLLVIDLIYAKFEIKTRIEAMQTLEKLWGGTHIDKCTARYNYNVISLIGDFFGIPLFWTKVHQPILERKIMDLIKLLCRLDSNFLMTLLRQVCSAQRVNSLPPVQMSALSIRALHHWVVLQQWFGNGQAIDFLKQVVGDVPQSTFQSGRRLQDMMRW